MAKIERFPNSIEQSEAANKAVEYLIELGIMDTNKSHELQFLILNVIEDYFEAQEKEENGIKLGWVVGNHPLQIGEYRFWLTEEEMATVTKIREEYPIHWENEVLVAIKNNELKPSLP